MVSSQCSQSPTLNIGSNSHSSYTKFLNSFHQLHFHHALIRRCNCHKGWSQGWKLQWRNTIMVNFAWSNTNTPLIHKYLKPRAHKNILMHSCWSLCSVMFSHFMIMPASSFHTFTEGQSCCMDLSIMWWLAAQILPSEFEWFSPSRENYFATAISMIVRTQVKVASICHQ